MQTRSPGKNGAAEDDLHVAVPPSKSQLQRALLAAAWRGGEGVLNTSVSGWSAGDSEGRFSDSPGLPWDVRELVLLLHELGLRLRPQIQGRFGDKTLDPKTLDTESLDPKNLDPGDSGSGNWAWSAPGFGTLGSLHLKVGESATTARLLAGALAFAGLPGADRRLDVSGSLARRGSAPLLHSIGGRSDAEPLWTGAAGEVDGGWPWVGRSQRMPRRLTLENPVSSQEVSALLFALAFEGGGELEVRGAIPSYPYVEWTEDVLRQFGVVIETGGGGNAPWSRRVFGPAQWPNPVSIGVEGDASAAAVAWTGGILAKRPVRVFGWPEDSKQGDLAILEIFLGLGLEVTLLPGDGWRVAGMPQRGLEVDLKGAPDLAPPLAALGAGLAAGHFGPSWPSRLTGLETLNRKESRRLDELCAGLQAMGLACEASGDRLEISAIGSRGRLPGTGGDSESSAPSAWRLDACGDHRMAFAFALLGLVRPGLQLRGPESVGKSWPTFWRDMGALLPPILG